MTNLEKFNALCKASNRCIEAGIQYNIGLTVQDGTRTPQEGLELMEKISWMDCADAVLFDVKIKE